VGTGGLDFAHGHGANDHRLEHSLSVPPGQFHHHRGVDLAQFDVKTAG
jgi:hypothetical protein